MAVILIAEDDPDNCEVLARLLRRAGHEALCEADGRAAVNALIQKKADLVLLDLTLPVMSGVDFLGVIRSYVRLKSLPVFVITGIDDVETLESITRLGVRQVFRKGQFKFDDLVAAINAELSPA